MSPVIYQLRNFKFKIHAGDHNPPHVHVEGGGGKLSIDLNTLEIVGDTTKFTKRSVNRIIEEVKRNRELFLNAWRLYNEED